MAFSFVEEESCCCCCCLTMVGDGLEYLESSDSFGGTVAEAICRDKAAFESAERPISFAASCFDDVVVAVVVVVVVVVVVDEDNSAEKSFVIDASIFDVLRDGSGDGRTKVKVASSFTG